VARVPAGLGIAAILTVPFVLLAEPITVLFGAGATAGLAASTHGSSSPDRAFLFVNIGYAARAEGTEADHYAVARRS
jgi:hypothetical protein